jgi:hypothetical protein
MTNALGLISVSLSLACAYALYTLVAAGQGAFPWGTSLLLSVLILCLSLALLQLPPPLPPLTAPTKALTLSPSLKAPVVVGEAPNQQLQKPLSHSELVAAFEPLIQALPADRQDTLSALKERFQTLTNETDMPAGPQAEAPWSIVVSHTTSRPGSIFRLQIEQLKGHDFTFRIFVDVDGTPEEAFDLMSDITKRADWDELTEKAGAIEQWDSMSAVQVRIFFL